MQALRRAIRELQRLDSTFNGTLHSAMLRMDGVLRQQLANLLSGQTDPWRVNVHTMNEIMRVFGKAGLRRVDFDKPSSKRRRRKKKAA